MSDGPWPNSGAITQNRGLARGELRSTAARPAPDDDDNNITCLVRPSLNYDYVHLVRLPMLPHNMKLVYPPQRPENAPRLCLCPTLFLSLSYPPPGCLMSSANAEPLFPSPTRRLRSMARISRSRKAASSPQNGRSPGAPLTSAGRQPRS
jgi:hypothetical protein